MLVNKKVEYVPGQAAEEDLLLKRGRHLLDSTSLSGAFPANGLWGWELRRMLAAGEEIFILDVRDPASFTAGRLGGSAHADFVNWADPETIGMLPRDRKIAVVCETGDKASQVVGGLRLLGFDAVSVKTGIHGLCQNGGTEDLIESIRSASFEVTRTPPERAWPERLRKEPFTPPEPRDFHALREMAAASMAATPLKGDYAFNVVSPAALSLGLNEQEAGNDPFLLDIRREEDYEGVGHIPGAVHVDFESALSEDALALLPRDRKIVTICYTGNLAAQLTTVLRLLGRDAAFLENGMVSWNRTPTTYHFLKDIEGADAQLAAG